MAETAEAPVFAAPPEDATEQDVAQGIRDGTYASPQKFGEFWLFDLRITGTGAAFRDALDEWAYRPTEEWTSPEFVERCAGLPVIFEHPDRSGLNADEFRERSIGTIRLPYVKGDEVWGIAQIFDADAAELMQTTHRSTSPGVTPPKGSEATTTKDGASVLVEGLPLVLDHLAVCENGVWDKNGPPSGIRLDHKDRPLAKSTEELEAELADAKRRADAAEQERDDAKARMDAMMADKSKKDESDKEAIEAAEKEKADKAKKDAADAKRDSRKDRHAKHDGDVMDCSRCDSEEKAEEEEAEEKAKKDAAAAPKEPVDADRGTEDIKDSKKRISTLEAEIASLKAANRPLTFEDRDAIAKAWGRADRAYQMLGDQAPQAYPGESPIAYRRRLAHGLRQFTQSWKAYAFHDAQDAQSFALVEDAIYAEALAHAKNPPAETMAGLVREIVTHPHGKTRVEFVGDAKAPWLPFTHPTKFAVAKISRPIGNVYR